MYKRQDQDFLDLDWSRVGGKKIIITLHGLEGSSNSKYILGMNRIFNQDNWDAVTMNFRGCSGEVNLVRRGYHSGETTDLDFVINTIFEKYDFDGVIHLAAESHVDRSIEDPMSFIKTNILGTVNLLNAARSKWKDFSGKRFYHVSTDEVYGSLGETGFFTEETPYDPRSPYSSSKASSDHIVRAYYHTYGLPIVISNCSNNYGPNQFPEKLLPLFINNICLLYTSPSPRD